MYRTLRACGVFPEKMQCTARCLQRVAQRNIEFVFIDDTNFEFTFR